MTLRNRALRRSVTYHESSDVAILWNISNNQRGIDNLLHNMPANPRPTVSDIPEATIRTPEGRTAREYIIKRVEALKRRRELKISIRPLFAPTEHKHLALTKKGKKAVQDSFDNFRPSSADY